LAHPQVPRERGCLDPQNAGREDAGGRKPHRKIGKKPGKRERESNSCRKGIGKSKETRRRLPKPGSSPESSFPVDIRIVFADDNHHEGGAMRCESP